MTGVREALIYGYYPGCSLHASAKEYDLSTRALFEALGIGLTEVPDWICCGATPAHTVDELLSLSLCAKNLAIAETVPGDLAVPCASCFSRLKTAQHELTVDLARRNTVAKVIESPVPLAKNIKHPLEIVGRDWGLEPLTAAVKKPLAGLKVACYYGCLLTRPPEVSQLDDAEAPTIMEQVIEAAGAETVSWSHRLECCGASFTLPRPGVVVKLTAEILAAAKDAGADCLTVGCPLCQGNLDLRQQEVEAQSGVRYDLPVLYFTQLLGLALGLAPARLGLSGLMVDPLPLLKLKGLL